jgi:hypothetical protein
MNGARDTRKAAIDANLQAPSENLAARSLCRLMWRRLFSGADWHRF